MTTKYSCDFCSSMLLTADDCREHEAKCDYNPDNKSCARCFHYGYARTCDEEKKLNWQPKGGPWENEDDIPEPMGCLLFGDQKWRTHCQGFSFKG